MPTTAVFLASLALGGMVFFSFVIAPLVHRRLPPEHGGPFIREAFSTYYPLMALLTGMAALTMPPFWPATILALIAIGFVLAQLLLRPAVNDLADRRAAGDLAAAAEFKRLHGISMALNLAQMVALALIVWVAIDR
ncbi:DUF4149 domain-containing protein [Oleomonas cavernae]|uniref:DUF4149 domain-containing protein n=1 Tax=Oleomonas cavernae TaxID=2320859 RepID=A0A418W9L0_9PROT|nr:DUF4149 domain-containing protein [Oleomonas cavernae]RJF86710.1 DUF4149 domain-containing protein [Oleomonas cavernae]